MPASFALARPCEPIDDRRGDHPGDHRPFHAPSCPRAGRLVSALRVREDRLVVDLDDIVTSAVAYAASDLRYIHGERPEALLVRSLRAGFGRDSRVKLVDGTPVYRLPGWTRPPGGVDVVVDLADGSGRLGIEAKVGKPDESIWDAIKLADVQDLDARVRTANLVSDAQWAGHEQGTELFEQTPTRQRSCRELIANSPGAWTGTMIGGKGIRPRSTVGGVHLTWVTEAPLTRHRGRRLVAVRVEPDRNATREHYDEQGFPTGYEPPSNLRAKVVHADLVLAQQAAGMPAPGDSTDPCHGYPWYVRWTQQRIASVLQFIGEDHAARACLRQRLARERAWQEHELRERFDPY